MKITIDLPDEIIEQAKTSPGYYPTYHFETIWKAIANGEIVESEEQEMTRERKKMLIRHLKYNLEIGADYLITDEDVVEIIKALEQEPEWIPVSEKLPENDKDVLACHSNGEMEVCYYHTALPKDSPYYNTLYKTGWYDEYANALTPGEPIAWMPLPKSYKTESEG